VSGFNRVKGNLGVLTKGISLNMDLLNGCHLRCPSCAVGSIGRRRYKLMDLDKFRRILDWAGHVRRVMLYVYSDPCMHPLLHLFVQECTDRGIDSWISTVLQATTCKFDKVIEARPTEFRISFAGWDHMSYYQGGAKKEVFNKKLRRVCKLPRHLETDWTMAFHVYDNNVHEIPRAKKLAEKHGLKFVALPCIFMVGEKVVRKDYSDKDKVLISHLMETPEDAIANMKHDRSYCKMWKQITIDAAGDLYLCQLIYNDDLKLGNFEDFTRGDVIRAMKNHPFCRQCMVSGMHTYQECYGEFIKYDDPIAYAEKKRRCK
jgi:radical SAM protein with 4Fe4S-binding SPASM domain